MSKKGKNKQKEVSLNKYNEAEEISSIVSDESPSSQSSPDPKPPEPVTVDDPVYVCQDAARRFIVGYKDGWLPGIEAHIKSHNAPLQGTESYFKNWFISWGAKVK